MEPTKEDFMRIVEKIQQKLTKERGEIKIETEVSLRSALSKKLEIARSNGKNWTLFVGKDGTVCHAVHPDGTFYRPPNAPKYLKNVTHKEHAMNHFLHHIKERFGDHATIG